MEDGSLRAESEQVRHLNRAEERDHESGTETVNERHGLLFPSVVVSTL